MFVDLTFIRREGDAGSGGGVKENVLQQYENREMEGGHGKLESPMCRFRFKEKKDSERQAG